MSAPAPPNASLLEALRDCGLLDHIDYHFAKCLGRRETSATATVLSCAALASRAVQTGHICLDLSRLTTEPLHTADGTPVEAPGWPPLRQLLDELYASALVGRPGHPAPLVLRGHRLYLQRYDEYESHLASELLSRARRDPEVDIASLREDLNQLFEEPAPGATPLGGQRLAACIACLHMLTILCGGPGTGKTTTVVKILCLLQRQRLRAGLRPLEILLLAPTGKAAARLSEAVASGLDKLEFDPATKACIKPEALTVHRALGSTTRLATAFRHDRENPWSADVVLVDEVSMVDLALLHHLVQAVRPSARLILQGDKDQLSSVEAGAILGDIYDEEQSGWLSAECGDAVRALIGTSLPRSDRPAGLGDCLVTLTHSYRYRADSALGHAARAVQRGDAEATLAAMDAASDCRLLGPQRGESPPAHHRRVLRELVVEGYRPYLTETDPEKKLEKLQRYRILCAYRKGPSGVMELNARALAWLSEANLLAPGPGCFENQPIMVTRNDYSLGLFNGDTGVVVRTESGDLRVCFEQDGKLRFVSPSRIGAWETVLAMTIHKSQGSEFDRVSVVLPQTAGGLLLRELVYTGITRAKQRADVVGAAEVLEGAVRHGVSRSSGLRQALWGEPAAFD